jgi:hypothetical protein
MAGLEIKVDGEWKSSSSIDEPSLYVYYNGLKVPTTSLIYAYKSYIRMGRIEKARLIKDTIDNLQV